MLVYSSALLQPVKISVYFKTTFLFLFDVAADATVADVKANPLAEESSLPKGKYITFNSISFQRRNKFWYDQFINENMMLKRLWQKTAWSQTSPDPKFLALSFIDIVR